MTDKLKAQVSAFLDDELLEEESELLVRRLCNDEELRQTALRYTLIGDAMRGSLHQIDAGLAGNIRRFIDEEPDAPAVAEVARVTQASRSGSLWRAAGGSLIAATVAAVALFTVQQLRAPGPGDASVAGVLPAEAPIVVPLDTATPNDPFTRAAPAPVSQAGLQNRMNRYLIRHNQYATTTGRQGVLTYLSMDTGDKIAADSEDSERTQAADAAATPPTGADGQ